MEILKKIGLKNRIIIINAALIAVVAGIAYFVILPSVSDIKKMQSEIDAQKLDLEEKYMKGQSLKKLTESLKVIEPRLEQLDQVFISQNRELEFITSLEKIAADRNVTQRISLGSPQQLPGKQFRSSALQLTLNGNFSDLYRYLEELESLDYYINISALDLTTGANPAPNLINDDTAGGRTNMSLSATVFWK